MKSKILGVLRSVQERFGIQHESLTHIEGGLGSQILNIIAFYHLQDKLGQKNAKCDLSYFNHPDRLGLWDWSLHHYGINLADLRKFESLSRTNLLKPKKDFLSDSQISQGYWNSSRENYLVRFSFDEELLQSFIKVVTEKSNVESYGAIHIRRGDYLQVASKVVGLDEYTQFLSQIRAVLPKLSFIITDSPLTTDEKQQLRRAIGDEREAVFLDGPEHQAFVLHCLMRRADVLVTSNSTFSFSAGLLGKNGQVVFSPLDFHAGKGSEKYNRSFRSVGSFTSWNLDNSRGTI